MQAVAGHPDTEKKACDGAIFGDDMQSVIGRLWDGYRDERSFSLYQQPPLVRPDAFISAHGWRLIDALTVEHAVVIRTLIPWVMRGPGEWMLFRGMIRDQLGSHQNQLD